MPDKITRIQIAGFKSIREMDLPLRNLNILIGANGSGKSNFISAFTFLRQLAEGHLQEYVARRGGADTLVYMGRKVTENLSFRVEFEDSFYGCELVAAVNDRIVVRRDYYSGESESGEMLSPDIGQDEASLSVSLDPALIDYDISDLIQRWQVYHFNDTSDYAKIRTVSHIDDNEYLRHDGANLASMLYLYNKKYPGHYRNIVDAVRLVAPFFDDFHLNPDLLNERMIKLAWRQRGLDHYFDAHSLSDGTLRFICLATSLLQPELPPLLILDEPELGLHPYAIVLLAGMLRSASMKTQVLVSTQSVTLVNQFSPDDIIVVDRYQEQSTFRRLNEEEIAGWLDEYSLGELWEKNVLGGRP